MTATLTPADLDALDAALDAIASHGVQWRAYFREELADAVKSVVDRSPALLVEVRRLREHIASIARARDNATKSMPTNQSIVDELTAAFFAAYGDYSDRCFCGPAAGEFVERAMRHAAGVAEEKLAAARLDAANARAVAEEAIGEVRRLWLLADKAAEFAHHADHCNKTMGWGEASELDCDCIIGRIRADLVSGVDPNAIRSRLASPSDFAARAREAVERLRESIGNQDTPEDVAALDADLASLLALLGVRS